MLNKKKSNITDTGQIRITGWGTRKKFVIGVNKEYSWEIAPKQVDDNNQEIIEVEDDDVPNDDVPNEVVPQSNKDIDNVPKAVGKVDFHGFLLSKQHAKYLCHVYIKEGEFWASCTLESKNFISYMLEGLGKALMIAYTPWSDISASDLEEM
ncbi:hypothetical protein COLO4_36683 [Corchorus olitorius]|uniref:Uncharacterized protein n=1 Tax=Corchorus olitorius TaxID=93759 RepID=A0A1R3G6B8_9ROSI|nr:hypothetical protein COLO4_36683 [Corchorus olitorius]